MWNWVITPACARLLLSHDGIRACCLDQGSAVTPLICLDGRWGDEYPCPSPSTVRACMGVAALKKIDLPPCEGDGDRPQRLRIILVSSAESEKKKGLFRDKSGWYWAIVSVSGWVAFLAALVTTVLARLYIATLYLIVLLLTGVVMRFPYGHRGRQIAKLKSRPGRRLVVATDNFNGGEWTAFIGLNNLVNALLNRPLQPIKPPTHPRLLQCLLFILVAFQWGLTITACGYQDWNAFVVFAWIALCALTSSFLYGEQASTKSWLESNGLRLERTEEEVELSCRRSMLSLLVALNPDKSIDTSTKWIDPILAPSEDRTAWEAALRDCLNKDQWEENIQACSVSGLLFHPRC